MKGRQIASFPALYTWVETIYQLYVKVCFPTFDFAFMASTTLNEYERKRLDNIRRNADIIASLNLHSLATDLAASTKRHRNRAESNKVPQQKKPKNQTPKLASHRSMRKSGILPDLEGLPNHPKIRRKPPTTKPKPWTRKLGSLSLTEAYGGDQGSDRALIETILGNLKKSEFGRDTVCEFGEFGKGDNLSDLVKKEEAGSFDLCSMTVNPENVARILPDRIMYTKFFPCSSSRIIVAGNKLGDVGFWNLDHQRDDGETKDGLYMYHSHSGSVSGISIHQHRLSKVYTSCYDGFVRSMDAEKEVFDLIYSSKHSICSLSQRSNDAKCVYFGDASGLLNIWDERMGKCSTRRFLHISRINSIDFSSENPNILATSSADGNVRVWDLRSIHAIKPETLNTFSHQESVRSAYFSPSGNFLASTSFDDKVGVHSGINYEETSMIVHKNQASTWIPPFRAIWGWDDSYIFIGSVKRGVDVISPSQRRTIFTLQSPLVSAIPCTFDAHPYNVGMLAGATGGGQVYVWTLS